MAVLSVPGAEGGWQKLVRVGDRFAGAKVAHIGFKRVWLHGGDAWCQIDRTMPAAREPAGPADRPAPVRPRPGAAARLPPDVASAIRQVKDDEFEIDRAVVDRIIEKRGDLMRGVQFVPKTEGGKPVALGLRGVREGSLLHVLGLRSGDELRSVNGFVLADPEAALVAYARLRTAEHLTVEIVREGRATSIDLHVR